MKVEMRSRRINGAGDLTGTVAIYGDDGRFMWEDTTNLSKSRQRDVAAVALLEANPDPSEDDVREWMKGNLCRCTGYYSIMESVVNAARIAQQANTGQSS